MIVEFCDGVVFLLGCLRLLEEGEEFAVVDAFFFKVLGDLVVRPLTLNELRILLIELVESLLVLVQRPLFL